MSMMDRAANGAADAAQEKIGHAADQAEKIARTAADYGRQGADTAYRAARAATEKARTYAQERPVQVALLALGGLLLASFLFRRR